MDIWIFKVDPIWKTHVKMLDIYFYSVKIYSNNNSVSFKNLFLQPSKLYIWIFFAIFEPVLEPLNSLFQTTPNIQWNPGIFILKVNKLFVLIVMNWNSKIASEFTNDMETPISSQKVVNEYHSILEDWLSFQE